MRVTTHQVAQANGVPVDLPIKEVNKGAVVIPVGKFGAKRDAALALPVDVAKERYQIASDYARVHSSDRAVPFAAGIKSISSTNFGSISSKNELR